MRHGDSGTLAASDEPDLVVGYRGYMERIAYLLESLDRIPDDDGGSMLDHTLVLLMSESGNGGGHASGNLPAIVAGNSGGGPFGRFLDYSAGLTGEAPQQVDDSHKHADRPVAHNLHGCI